MGYWDYQDYLSSSFLTENHSHIVQKGLHGEEGADTLSLL